MTTLRNTLLGLALVVSLTTAAAAQDNTCGGKAMKGTMPMDGHGMVFSIEDPMGRNSVTFKNTAPLEDIVGTSNKVSGHLVFDPAHPENGGHGELTIPVASLNTGIPLRDEHLAGADWLDAQSNPNINFKISKVTDVREVKVTAETQTYDVLAEGEFSLNGVTKRIVVPARISYRKESEATKQRQPGNLLAVRTNFEIPLAAYGITGPTGMDLIGSKVGEVVGIELSVVASSAAGTMAGNPCGGKATMAAGNPCGGKAAMNPCGGK